MRYRVQLWVMLAPYLVGMLVLVVVPALVGLPLAFTDYDAIRAPKWVGLANFRALVDDPVYRKAVFNSLFYIALAVPVRTLAAFAVALLLVRRLRGAGAYRSAVYLPTVIPDIAWALLWLWIFNPIYGPLNLLLGEMGLPTQAWMIEEWGARFAIIFMMSWQIGEGLVICLAGLGDIPGEVLEQAAVDGASRWQTLTTITIPLVSPFLLILLFRDTILSLQSNFVPSLIVGRGEPNYATMVLPLWTYTNSFDFLRIGYGAAMTWTMYGLTVVVLWAQYRVAQAHRLGFRDGE